MKRYLYLILFTFTISLAFGQSEIYFDEVQLNEYDNFQQEIFEEKDEMKIVQAVKVTNIDPIFMKDQYSIRVVNYLYETLFNYNEKGEIVPNLVQKWTWNDERNLEIELRDDIYFQNGDKMSAKDVKSSLDRMLESGVFKDFFNDVQNVKVLDKNLLEIKLKGKNKLFTSMLTYYMCSITKEVNGIIYGTGPYKLDKITNKEVVLSKNKYFRKDVKPSKIEILSEVSDRKRALLYFDEAVDVVLDLSPKQIKELKKEGVINENTDVIKTKELDTIAIMFGNKNNIFNKKKNREIIESIIDRERIVKDIYNVEIADTFFPKKLFKANLSTIKEENTLEIIKENKLLNEKIEIITLNDDISLKIANKLKTQLIEKGLQVNVTPYQQEAYLMKMEKQDYEIAIYNILFDEKYLIYNLGKVMVHDMGNKEMYNATLPFLEILKDEEKQENRDKIYDKIVYLISKNKPYIPLVHREKVILESKKIKLNY